MLPQNEDEKNRKEAERQAALAIALANKTKLNEEAADQAIDAKRLTDAFAEQLKLYIHDKETHLRKELRDGGRQLTWRRLVNPSALTRYLGGLSKNPDHAEAYNQRLTLLVYAHYLSSRLANLKNQYPKAGEVYEKNAAYLSDAQALLDEMNEIQKYLVDKEYNSSFVVLLKNTLDGAKKLDIGSNQASAILSEPEQEFKRQFRLLWPFYIITKDPGELYNNANFSAEMAYSIAKRKNINVISDQLLLEIFNELRDDYKSKVDKKFNDFSIAWYRYVKDNPVNSELEEDHFSAEIAYQLFLKGGKSYEDIYTKLMQRYEAIFPKEILTESSTHTNQHSDSEIFKEGLAKLNSTDNKDKKLLLDFAAKNLGKGIGLSSYIRASDRAMGMNLDPERFATGHTIKKIEADKLLNDKGEKLEDGWYQYVIPSEGKYQHDFRYLKCSNKKGSFLQYGKYAAHSEIAGGVAVYSAGAFKVFNGKIVEMDNSSGHYENPETARACNTYALMNLAVLGQANPEKIIQIEFPKLTGKPFREKTKRKLLALFHGLYSAEHADLARVTEERPIPSENVQGDHLRSLRSSQYSRLFNTMQVSMTRKGPDKFTSSELDKMEIADLAALIKGNMELIKHFPKASKEYQKNNDKYISAIIRRLDKNPGAMSNLFSKVADREDVKDYILKNIIAHKNNINQVNRELKLHWADVVKQLNEGHGEYRGSNPDLEPKSLFQEKQSEDKITFYSDGYNDEKHDSGAFYDLITSMYNAKEQICITGWTLSPDLKFDYWDEDTKQQLKISLPDLFVELAYKNPNFKIQALIWENIAPDFIQDSKRFIQYLEAAAQKKSNGNPEIKKQILDKIQVKFTTPSLGYSDHAKMVIVDKNDMFMGGLDLAVNRDNPKIWHDCHCRIQRDKNSEPGSSAIDDSLDLFKARFDVRTNSFKNKVTHKSFLLFKSNTLVNTVALKRENKPKLASKQIKPRAIEDTNNKKSIQLLTSIRKEYFDPSGKIRPDYVWDKKTHSKELLNSQIQAIQNSEKFIYMESQFFIGPSIDKKTGLAKESHNLVISALLEKILQKIDRGEDFHFYCQLPFRPEGRHDEIAVESVLRKQWNTMEYFINEVKVAVEEYNKSNPDAQKNVADYLTFTNLGFYDPLKSTENHYEMKYTHSKLMIIDDNTAFIGSNNCNERSNKGNRDHEICMKMQGHPEIKDYRQQLMAQQIGIGKDVLQAFESKGNTPQSSTYVAMVHERLDNNLKRLNQISNPIGTPWGNISRVKLENGVKPPHVPDRSSRLVTTVQNLSQRANSLTR